MQCPAHALARPLEACKRSSDGNAKLTLCIERCRAFVCKLLDSSLTTTVCAVSQLHFMFHVATSVCRQHSGSTLCRSCTHPCKSTPHLRSIMYLATWSTTTAASEIRPSGRQRKKHAGALAQGAIELQLPECGALLLRRACYLCATLSTYLIQVVLYVRLRSDCKPVRSACRLPPHPPGSAGTAQAVAPATQANWRFGEFERHTRGIGAKLLGQMGYEAGRGLGRQQQGIVDPVQPEARPERMGLGMAD